MKLSDFVELAAREVWAGSKAAGCEPPSGINLEINLREDGSVSENGDEKAGCVRMGINLNEPQPKPQAGQNA